MRKNLLAFFLGSTCTFTSVYLPRELSHDMKRTSLYELSRWYSSPRYTGYLYLSSIWHVGHVYIELVELYWEIISRSPNWHGRLSVGYIAHQEKMLLHLISHVYSLTERLFSISRAIFVNSSVLNHAILPLGNEFSNWARTHKFIPKITTFLSRNWSGT